MSVIQLDNGEVHNIYELKDIKEFVDQEVYNFIEENTIELKDDYEDINELYSEIDDLKGENHQLTESMNWVYNHLDDLLDDLENVVFHSEYDYKMVVEYLKECKSSLE